MFVRSLLKSQAKDILRTKYVKLFLVALALTFCMGNADRWFNVQFNINGMNDFGLAESINITLFNYHFTLQSIFLLLAPLIIILILVSVIATIVVRFLILNPLEVGFKEYFVNASFDEERIQDVANVFTQGNFKTVAWTMFRRDLEIVLFALLLVIPGIIRSLTYRFVPYILADYPELSADEVLYMSKRMTEGIRFDIFILDISYFAWYIPGWFTGGFTNYLVHPYVYQTEAQLYLQIKDEYRRLNDAEY